MTIYCAVPGCISNSKTTDYTFHRFPRNLISRARWILALRRPVRSLGSCALVCSRHFEERMFSDRGRPDTRGLVKNAVPTLFLPPKTSQPSKWLPIGPKEETSVNKTKLLETKPARNHLHTKMARVDKINPNITRHSEEKSSVEVVACRACLAVDGALYALRGSSFEDSFLELSGTALSLEEGFPRHLCAFCLARLSRCAAFRASCRRSAALLQGLLATGPLTMGDIKAVDRHTHKLTSDLTQAKAYHFQTNPYLDVLAQFTNENESQDSQLSDYTEVEYLDSDDGMDNNELNFGKDNYSENDVKVEIEFENSTHSETEEFTETIIENESDDTYASEETVDVLKKTKRKRMKSGKENTGEYLKKHKHVKTEVDDDPSDIDTDTSEEIIEMRKRVEVKKKMMKKVHPKRLGSEEFPNIESIRAFEKEYDCEIKLLSKEEQEREVEERKRNNKCEYCCDLCGKGFNGQRTLLTHLTHHDPGLPHECAVCRLRFRSRHALTKHWHGHRAAFTCNRCGRVSRTRTYAKDHALTHMGATYACPYCQRVYHHQTSYYNHVRVQHPGQHEACDRCGETFAAGRGLAMHRALRHRLDDKSDTNLKCTVCQITFSSSDALQRHLELSVGVSHAALWPCAACGESCASDAARTAHAAEKHPPDQLHCAECNKTFLSAASFARHAARKHAERRAALAPPRTRGAGPSPRCVCHLCGKLLKNSTLLRYHLNGHLDEKPFPCARCPKAFPHQGALNLHMRVHTGERPYQCEQCPQAFASLSNLTRHIKYVHQQRRALVACGACGKLMRAASLAPHVRAVHQRRPYVRRKRPAPPRRPPARPDPTPPADTAEAGK